MRRRRWGLVLGSAAFHALLALLFVLDLARKPAATPIPAMTVFLERVPTQARPTPSARRAARARRAGAKADVAPTSPAAVPALPASPAASSAEGAAAGTPAPDLRGLGGCRLATLDRLSPEERARCQERLAQAMDKARAQGSNLDPAGRYVRDARPYLTRPPENGCKPVGAIRQEPMGQTSATLAVGCARPF